MEVSKQSINIYYRRHNIQHQLAQDEAKGTAVNI